MSRKISGPRGSNQLSNPPDPIDVRGVSYQRQAMPTQATGPMRCSMANRKSRPIKGPRNSRITPNELDYEGT
jgi:hypothetical protein